MRKALAKLAASILATTGLGLAAGAEAGEILPAAPPERVPLALPGAPPFAPALREALARALVAAGTDRPLRTRHRTEDGWPRYTNRLLLEPSPYLRQHAHNPVDWHAWGDEAFALARRLERPVLLSIGYSTCHWCHVMEEESFDDPEIAHLLNQHFVAIKVDREARPDIDAVYMSVVHALLGSGGWPLHVWLTPERKPFYAGTYFPPRDAPGRPGFPTVLQAIRRAYAEEPDRVRETSEQLTEVVRRSLEHAPPRATQLPAVSTLVRAVHDTLQRADPVWGGIGGARKFPASLPVRLLLRYHRRSGDSRALEVATLTLEKMARGGIRDHLGGGFHRYATDRRWRLPHFEKMLSDNALLALAYLDAWRTTQREDFAKIVHEVLAYVLREMTAPGGGFYTASDADSPDSTGRSREGLFFTWTRDEIRAALAPDAAQLVIAHYGVGAPGELDGRSVLHVAQELEPLARSLDLPLPRARRQLDRARRQLLAVRARRPAPFRDEKILAGWNGLAISAFAQASFALDQPHWRHAAVRAADFLLGALRSDGRLLRIHQHGQATGPAFLEDYAFLIAGLLDLYEADGALRWLREAVELQRELDARYWDSHAGGYFRTASDQERLIAREKPGIDGALPSGNSVAALNLLRLHAFTGDPRTLERAGRLLSAFHEPLTNDPTLLSEMLAAVDFASDLAKEVVLVRPGADADDAAMLRPLRRAYVPNRIVSVVTEGDQLERHAKLVPLLARKTARGGHTTAYVCENRVCSAPTTDPGRFAEQLARMRPLPR